MIQKNVSYQPNECFLWPCIRDDHKAVIRVEGGCFGLNFRCHRSHGRPAMDLKQLDFSMMPILLSSRISPLCQCDMTCFAWIISSDVKKGIDSLSKEDAFPPKHTLNMPLNMARKCGGSLPWTTLTSTGAPPSLLSNTMVFKAAVPRSSWLE